MTLTKVNHEIWTTADLELLPESTNRYETINGELLVTRAPNWQHQEICDGICSELRIWSRKSGLGKPISGAGIIFTDVDNVIPDVIWISNDRLKACEDSKGHFTAAPELVIEVMSVGGEKRDAEIKLKLYSSQSVREYWIFDRFLGEVQVYRRLEAKLTLITTLHKTDNLTSPLLPNFSCNLTDIFLSN
jgi:Uma2 family endonuclease